MGNGLAKEKIESLKAVAAGVPDRRKPCNRLTYGMADITLSAFTVFYFQRPSLPDFQRKMERERKRNNPRMPFGVEQIPGKDQAGRFFLGVALRS
jgi:hypothetical protein